jgi:hypothetical protein
MFREAENPPLRDSIKQLARDGGEETNLKEMLSKNLRSILEGGMVNDKATFDVHVVMVFGAKGKGIIIFGKELAVKIEKNSAVISIDSRRWAEMEKYIQEVSNELPEPTQASIKRAVAAGDELAPIKEVLIKNPEVLLKSKQFKDYPQILNALSENQIEIAKISQVPAYYHGFFDELRDERIAVAVLMREQHRYSAQAAIAVHRISNPSAVKKIFARWGLRKESKIVWRHSKAKEEQERAFINFREKWSDIDEPAPRKDELKKDLEDLAGKGIGRKEATHYLTLYVEEKLKRLKELEERIKSDEAYVNKLQKGGQGGKGVQDEGEEWRREELGKRLRLDKLYADSDRRKISNLQKTIALLDAEQRA